MKNRTEIFCKLTNKACETYENKNHDYGDSFAKVRQKFPNSVLIRLNDKLSRLEVLMSGEAAQVTDESIDDTLLDLANYALMELTERIWDREKSERAECPKDLLKTMVKYIFTCLQQAVSAHESNDFTLSAELLNRAKAVNDVLYETSWYDTSEEIAYHFLEKYTDESRRKDCSFEELSKALLNLREVVSRRHGISNMFVL